MKPPFVSNHAFMRFKDSFRALRNILTLALEIQNTFTHTLPVFTGYWWWRLSKERVLSPRARVN